MSSARRSRRVPDLEPVPVAVLLPPVRGGSRRPRRSPDRPDDYGLTGETAATLLASYTRVGQLVVDLHASPAIRVAAQWLDRPLTTPTATAGQPTTLPALVIDKLNAHDIADLHALTERIRALRSALVEGGYLILGVPAEPIQPSIGNAGQAPVDPVTEAIVAARTAGLTYQQHLVTVYEPPPEPPPGHLVAPSATGRHRATHRHLLAFRDGDLPAVEGGANA